MSLNAISTPAVGARREFAVKFTLRNGNHIIKNILSRPYPHAANKNFKARNQDVFDRALDFAQILDCNNIL
jgi:hypothetical protein